MGSQGFLITILWLAGCGTLDTAGAPVSVDIQVATGHDDEGSPSEFVVDTGWHVHLEKAEVVLGPIYLRAPRQKPMSLWRALLPVAHAHPDHAQTLTEGQVLGEFLQPKLFDALSRTPVVLGAVTMQAGRLDRLSVVLAGPGKSAAAQGHTAYVRGWAEREGDRVEFDCGLRIEGDSDEAPENLEARRRVDQILIEHTPVVRDGDALVLEVHPHRWFERVDFAALVGRDDPCPTPQSEFGLQWYLGIRRPEAFGAKLVTRE